MNGMREIAWAIEGASVVWAGEGEPVPYEGKAKDVKHECRVGDCGGVFQCTWCKRCVPWCFGGDGTKGTIECYLCNDCWAERHRHGKDQCEQEE